VKLIEPLTLFYDAPVYDVKLDAMWYLKQFVFLLF